MDGDYEYFRSRISEERALAECSDSASLRDFHRLLAEAYSIRLANMDGGGGPLHENSRTQEQCAPPDAQDVAR